MPHHMNFLLFQILLPFILSAIIVILITILAEKYGTKIGGIVGTMPSTIIIAFIFIAHNKGLEFAAQASSIVPAELAINILFLFIFALFAHRLGLLAMVIAFIAWAILSALLFLVQLDNIFISLLIFFITVLATFLFLEHKKQIPSSNKVSVQYTTKKIITRGVLAGAIIAISVLLSNINATLSGIFSVFPAILSSTMIIQYKEHGPVFATAMAKTMICGISSVAAYATAIYFLYPLYGVVIGSCIAFSIGFTLTMVLYVLRYKIR